MGIILSSEKKKEIKRTLYLAICDGNVHLVKSIVEQEPDLIKCRLEQGRNPIHVAVLYNRDHHVLELLLSYCRSLSSPQNRLLSQLHSAATKGINQSSSKDGMSPLMMACDAGDEQAMRLLLDANCDYWMRDRQYCRTCMHYVASKGHVALVKPLVEQSLAWDPSSSIHRTSLWPLVDIATSGGCTPLMYAAWCDDAEMIAELLANGADPEKRSLVLGFTIDDPFCTYIPEGSTALHVAAKNGSMHAAAMLLTHYHRCYNQYVTQLEDDRRAHARGVTPPPQPRVRPRDPRLALDGIGRTPLIIARNHSRAHLLGLLNPFTSLAVMLDGLERPVGVPSLKKLAAKASQQVLLAQVDSLMEAIQAAKAQAVATKQSHRRRSLQKISPSKSLKVEPKIPFTTKPPRTASSSAPKMPQRPAINTEGSLVPLGGPAAGASGSGAMKTIFERESMEGKSQAVHLHQSSLLSLNLYQSKKGTHMDSLLPAVHEVQQGLLDSVSPPEVCNYPSPRSGVPRDVPRPSLRSVSSWRRASRISNELGGSHGIPAPMEQLEWPLEVLLNQLPRININHQMSLEAPDGEHVKPCSGFMTPKGMTRGSGTAVSVVNSRPKSHHVSSRGDPLVSVSGVSSIESVEAITKVLKAERGAGRPGGKRADQLERRLERQEQGLHHLTQGMLHVSSSDPSLSSLVRPVALGDSASPQKPAGSLEASSPGEQLPPCTHHSALSHAVSQPLMEQQMLHAVACLADHVEDDHLEQTLMAARYHRLVNGVHGTQPSPMVTLLKTGPDLGGMEADKSVHDGSHASSSFETVQGPSLASPQDGDLLGSVFSNELPLATFSMGRPPTGHSLFTQASASPKHALSSTGLMSRHGSASGVEEDEFERTCGVCLDVGDFILAHPCSHKICISCATELIKLHPMDPAPCPFCRGIIKGFAEVSKRQ